MQAIDFHVLSQHCNEALQNFPILLRKQGFEILDLREADLFSDADGSKVEEVYIYGAVAEVRKIYWSSKSLETMTKSPTKEKTL